MDLSSSLSLAGPELLIAAGALFLLMLGVYADRVRGRVILISTLDNLVKGSAGQAIQNFNLMFGLPETQGLEQVALFP